MSGEGAEDIFKINVLGTTHVKDMKCCNLCNTQNDCQYWVREYLGRSADNDSRNSAKCWLKKNHNGATLINTVDGERRGGVKKW